MENSHEKKNKIKKIENKNYNKNKNTTELFSLVQTIKKKRRLSASRRE